MRFSLFFPIILFFLGCSKAPNNSPSDKHKTLLENEISFQSPMHFVYDSKLKNTEIIATFRGENIGKQQFGSNDPALKSLYLKKREQLLLTAYKKALHKKNGKRTLELPFAEPKKGIKVFLKTMHLKEDPNILFEFSKEGLKQNTIKIDSDIYTNEELSASNLLLAKTIKNIFTVKMNLLEEIVSRRTLLKEAESQKMAFDQYVQKNVTNGSTVNDDEAKQYAIENNIPENSINSELLARLKSIIGAKRNNQELIKHSAKILGKIPIKIAFKNPTIKTAPINIPKSTPLKGSGNMSITLISNFLCEKCKELEKLITTSVDKNRDDLQLSYIFNFKAGDRRTRMVAEASLCIAKQDESKFWDFQESTLDASFDGQEKKINETVKALGLDYAAYRKCFLAREFKKTVDDQLAAVKNLGYINLPALVINGQVFENPKSMDSIETAINDLLSTSNSSSSKSWWQWIKGLFSWS